MLRAQRAVKPFLKPGVVLKKTLYTRTLIQGPSPASYISQFINMKQHVYTINTCLNICPRKQTPSVISNIIKFHKLMFLLHKYHISRAYTFYVEQYINRHPSFSYVSHIYNVYLLSPFKQLFIVAINCSVDFRNVYVGSLFTFSKLGFCLNFYLSVY